MKTKTARRPINKIQLIVGIVFCICGIGALIGAALLFFSPGVPEEFVAATDATIARIDRYTHTVNGELETDHEVFVEYTVNGERYETPLDYYDSSMRRGGTILINYDTRDPGVIFTPGAKELGVLIVSIIGVLFTAIGIIVLRVRFPGEPSPAQMFNPEKFDREMDLLERIANGEVEIVEKNKYK